MSIRARLALWLVATTVLLIGGSAAGLYLYLDRSMLATVDGSLRSRADDLDNVVSAAPAADIELRRRRLAPSDESYVLVVDARGRTLASSGRPDAAIGAIAAPDELPPSGRIRTRRAGDDSLRLLELPATTSDGRSVTLVVGEALDRRDDTLAALRAALFAGVPVLVLLVVGGALLQVRRPLRAVERVRRQAAAYDPNGRRTERGGHDDRRIVVPAGDDEITRLAHTVNEMLGRIDRAVAQQRRFVASASHELRTPLAILKAELEAAAAMPPEAAHAALATLEDEVDRLALLVDGLLVVAEQQRDSLHVERTAIDVESMAETVAERYRDRAGRAGRAIHVDDGATGALTLHGDRILLEQALANLVDNSLRHGAGTIRIELRDREGAVALRVSDEGGGIDADVADAGFAPFTRGNAGAARGTGLGLSLVHSIAVAHGGDARYETDGSLDARFVTIELPG